MSISIHMYINKNIFLLSSPNTWYKNAITRHTRLNEKETQCRLIAVQFSEPNMCVKIWYHSTHSLAIGKGLD